MFESLYRIWVLVKKEMQQLFRDRIFAPLIIFGPVMELSAIAWATGAPIEHLPTALVDLDMTDRSRSVVVAFDNTGTFDFDYILQREDDVRPLVESGEVVAALIIPVDYSENLSSPYGEQAHLGLVLDGADPMAARAARQSAEGVVETINVRLFREWNDGREVDFSLVQPRVRVRFNEEMKKSTFTLPAELGLLLFAMSLIVAGISISREKERGTLEQIFVTPVTHMELVVAKSVPAVIVGFISFILMLMLAIHVFDVPMRGSWMLLLGVSFLFLFVELGIGLMASAYSNNQMQAAMLVMAWVMIEFLFNGYGVPVDNMHPLMQKVAVIFPIYHYMFAFRSILLKGAGLEAFWEHILVALLLGVIINSLAIFFLSRQKWE